MSKTIKGAGDIYEKDLYGDLGKSAKEALPLMEKVNEVLKATTVSNDALIKSEAKDVAGLAKVNEGLKKTNVAFEQKLKLDKQIIAAQTKISQGRTKEGQQLQTLKTQLQFEARERKKVSNETLKLTGAYAKESARLKELRTKYKDLAISEKGVSKEQAILLRQVTQLDSKLKKIDTTVGQSQRNVGNYRNSLKGVATSMKGILFAGGVAGVVLGIGRAFKDAFNRVREFDKEMNNLAGISGFTRKELSQTEENIKRVAGASTKTSNEVAKLATTLFALGKSPKEVNRLLKPVNDLSIALGATSDESGELLVGTLNAFQKGAESGQHFADVIAKMRTSTSLDFERIKDSLGFVAATANVMNLTVGETGALIGVLQDNGVKAARAGRLLNSSFIKLAKEGKTLEGSLDRINKAQDRGADSMELLQIAEADFGTQSASLGIILANNRDRIAELSNEFDNLSDGSLKKLTDEQLKSMDAQIKILDSTWEKFILSLDSGESAVGNMTRGVTQFLGAAITGFMNLDLIAKQTFDGLINFRNEELSRTLDGGWVTETGVNINKIREEFDKIPLTKIAKDVDKVRETWIDLLGEDRTDAALLFTQYIRERSDAEKDLAEENSRLEESEKDVGKEQKERIKSTKELTGLIEKQSKVVSDLNTEIQRATSEDDIFDLSNKVDIAKEELDRLNRIVSSSREEFDKRSISLIEDDIDRAIEGEKAKSEAVLKQIRSNATTTIPEKQQLIALETERLNNFTRSQELKREQERIKRESDFFKASIDQKRTGFKTEKEFEEFKAAQLQGLRISDIDQEIAALKEFGDEKSKLRIKQLEAEKEGFVKFAEQNVKDFGELQQAILDKIEEAIAKRSEKRIEEFDKQIAGSEDHENRLRTLADKGSLAAEQSIVEEERKQQQLQQAKQKEERKQELITSGFKVFSALLEQGKNPSEATLETAAILGALPAIIEAIPAFYEGTENTGTVASPLDSNGGRLSVLHDNERVMTAKQNKKMGNTSNEEAASIVEKHNKGMFGELYEFNQQSIDGGLMESINMNGLNKGIERKLDQLNQSIKSIEIPETTVSADELRNILTITKKTASKIQRQHSKLN